jgi:hypothetical protein
MFNLQILKAEILLKITLNTITLTPSKSCRLESVCDNRSMDRLFNGMSERDIVVWVKKFCNGSWRKPEYLEKTNDLHKYDLVFINLSLQI